MSDTPKFSLEERFTCGAFTIEEVAALASLSPRKVRKDASAGLLRIEKFGRSARVRGPNARAYLAGQSTPASAA